MSNPQREMRVLMAIDSGATTAREIAARCGSDVTTINADLRRLHDGGVVRRTHNPDWSGGRDKAPLYLWKLAPVGRYYE